MHLCVPCSHTLHVCFELSLLRWRQNTQQLLVKCFSGLRIPRTTFGVRLSILSEQALDLRFLLIAEIDAVHRTHKAVGVMTMSDGACRGSGGCSDRLLCRRT